MAGFRVSAEERQVTAVALLGRLADAADVDFLAIENQIPVLPASVRLNVGDIRAAAGFGRADPHEILARGDFWQQVLFYLLLSVSRDQVPPSQVEQDVDGDRHAQVRPSQFLNGDV